MPTNSANLKMPVVFLGHGSPMNALASNAYTKILNDLAQNLPRPKAILVISAHWLTAGTYVLHMSQPKTIHDFYGFPEELFMIQYPAAGAPDVAETVRDLVVSPQIHLDDKAWGLDHGTWSVLKHMYPKADVPVIQLSIDMSEGPQFHLDLGKKLAKLRDQGILIVGSGNIVHNLRRIRWADESLPYDWAIETDNKVEEALRDGDHQSLTGEILTSAAGRLSVPTPDHYYPLLYAVGAASRDEEPKFIYEGLELGSISMRSVIYGG